VKIHEQFGLTTLSAKLLIVASLVCVLFGNGVHVHYMVDHLIDHGDVHIVLHAHNQSQDAQTEDHHTSDQEKDSHQVAEVDLTGILSHSRLSVSHPDVIAPIVAVVLEWDFPASSDNVFELDLPPPEIDYPVFSPSSFSLRAPPLA